jgi:hypothetical protein
VRATIIALAVAAVLAGGQSWAGETRADRYAQDLQQARAAVASRDYAAALAAYERLIRILNDLDVSPR